MIHIDLTNDAPMVECDGSEGTGALFHITTATLGSEADEVSFQPENGEESRLITVSASARSRMSAGSKVVEYSVRERDLYGYGVYEVRSWTRRGQERHYHLTFAVAPDDETKCLLTVGPTSTPCSWVTESEVHPSTGEPVTIELPLV